MSIQLTHWNNGYSLYPTLLILKTHLDRGDGQGIRRSSGTATETPQDFSGNGKFTSIIHLIYM